MGNLGLQIKERGVETNGQSLNDCLANYIKADVNFIDGIRRGVDACKQGRLRAWAEIKGELGIG